MRYYSMVTVKSVKLSKVLKVASFFAKLLSVSCCASYTDIRTVNKSSSQAPAPIRKNAPMPNIASMKQ